MTLSRWSVWQVIQKSFQYIGWFQRSLSTAIYIVILLLLFAFYIIFLRLIKSGKFKEKEFWKLLLPISLILLFSYNAFSYDIFNYMFYPRILILHHENPYIHRPMDYLNDPWVNFMRWIHVTYPYGPVWLGLTIPLSLIGFQIFLPTLFLFKALMATSFLGTVYFIGKIMKKLSPDKKTLAMASFAFNPLVIIEALVSGHNDIVMMFFAVFAIYKLLDRKYILAFLLLFLSIGIKFSTVVFLPLFIISILWKFKKWNKFFLMCVGLMTITVIFATMRTDLQPWYLLWVLPFSALLLDKKWVVFPVVALSAGLLLHYAPFLYTGNWNPPIPTIKLWLTAISLGCGLTLVFISIIFKNEKA